MTDGTDPISGATVKIGSVTQTTGADGKTDFTLSGGDYTYLVQNDGYAGVHGSISADKQTDAKTIALSAGSGYYSVQFNVKDDKGINLNHAQVTIGADTETADDSGNVEFFLTNGDYAYTASAMGRISDGGSITVGSANTSKAVVLATDPNGVDMVINAHKKGKLGNEIDAILTFNSLGADAVRSLTVHGGVMDSNDFAYSGIKKLFNSGSDIFTSVDLSDISLEGNNLPEAAFYAATHLAHIKLPSSVTEIGAYAFAYCPLKTFTFPENVTTIGDSVFEYCGSLTDVTFPASVTSLGSYLFSNSGYGTAPVTDVHMLSSHPTGITVGSDAFFVTGSAVLHVPAGSVGAYYGDGGDGDATDKKWYGLFVYDPDAAAPVLKGTWAGWWSGKAYFNFMSDIPGVFYYAVVDDGAGVPDIDTTGAGTALDGSLRGYVEISGPVATAKDVYVVAKGANGKISEKLKADIPVEGASPVDVTVTGHASGDLEDEVNAQLTSLDMSYNYDKVGGLAVNGGVIGANDVAFIGNNIYNPTSVDFSGTSFEGNTVPTNFLSWSGTIKSLKLPAGVTAIGNGAFYELDALESITLGSATPPSVGEDVFSTVGEGAVVYVPGGSKAAYLAVNDGNTADGKWYGLTVVETSVLALQASPAGGRIYTGGRITITPNIGGGTWDFNEEYLSRDGNTFTGLKAGTARVTYTVGAQSKYVDVIISESELPSTGQDFTLPVALVSSAVLLGGLAALLFARKKRRENRC